MAHIRASQSGVRIGKVCVSIKFETTWTPEVCRITALVTCLFPSNNCPVDLSL